MATKSYGTGYLKKISEKEQAKPKFNLFDFSTVKTGPTSYQLPKSVTPTITRGPASIQTPKSIQAGLSVKTGPASVQMPESIRVAQQVQPTGQVARIGTQTQAEGQYNDIDLANAQKLKDMGVPKEDIIRLVNIKKQQREGTQPTQDKGINTGIGGVVEGAISQVPAFISNVASVVPQTLSKGAGYVGEKLGVAKEDNPFYTSGIGDAERLKQFGEASKQAIKKFGIEVDDTTAQKIGEELTNIAGSTLLPGGSGVTKIKGAGVLGTAGKGAVLGAKMTPGYIAGSEGRLPTVGEELTGIAGGAVLTPAIEKVAIPAVTGLAQKGKKYGTALLKGGTEGLSKSVQRDLTKVKQGIATPTTITRNIPEAIVRRDLGFTPTERRKLESILGKTESQYILEKGLAGKGKEELAETFSKQANDAYKGISEKLKGIDIKVKSSYADEALQDMLDQLNSKPKIQRAYAKDIAAIENMLKTGEYTLNDLNNIRRAFDKVNTGMYTAKGEVRSGVEAGIDVDIRNGIKRQLEKEASKYGIDVKQMNQELRAGIELKEALLRRLSQEERNNFIGLQDLGVSAILSGGEPITALATIGAKKYAESVAPSIAQKLYNLNKTTNVSSRLTRGNPITGLPKSSKLGLTNSTMNNMVQPPKVKPKTPNKPLIKEGKIESIKEAPSENLQINKPLLNNKNITPLDKAPILPKNATNKEMFEYSRDYARYQMGKTKLTSQDMYNTNSSPSRAKGIAETISRNAKYWRNEAIKYQNKLDNINYTPNKINNKGFIELNPKMPKPQILKPKVSDELKPLIEEAKKYKSADEFIKDVQLYKSKSNPEIELDKISQKLADYVNSKGHNSMLNIPEHIRNTDIYKQLLREYNIADKKYIDFQKSLIGKQLIKLKSNISKKLGVIASQKIRMNDFTEVQLKQIYEQAHKK